MGVYFTGLTFPRNWRIFEGAIAALMWFIGLKPLLG